jgi:hypothetical protein
MFFRVYIVLQAMEFELKTGKNCILEKQTTNKNENMTTLNYGQKVHRRSNFCVIKNLAQNPTLLYFSTLLYFAQENSQLSGQ